MPASPRSRAERRLPADAHPLAHVTSDAGWAHVLWRRATRSRSRLPPGVLLRAHRILNGTPKTRGPARRAAEQVRSAMLRRSQKAAREARHQVPSMRCAGHGAEIGPVSRHLGCRAYPRSNVPKRLPAAAGLGRPRDRRVSSRHTAGTGVSQFDQRISLADHQIARRFALLRVPSLYAPPRGEEGSSARHSIDARVHYPARVGTITRAVW